MCHFMWVQRGKFIQTLLFSDLDNKDEDDRANRGQQEGGTLMKHLSCAREEAVCATGVNKPSEEAETLHDIANILLLLKQKKEE